MRNQTIDYHECLVTLEPRRRTQRWGAEARVSSRSRRWLAGLGALLPAALLAAIGWRL
ncbi:MAG: hypothetical protein ACQGVK_26070 [Myxococcota bacterium]